jgi:hypothetical protein
MIVKPIDDLEAILAGRGFSSPWLWDVYGDCGAAGYQDAPYGDDPNRERRLYRWVARLARIGIEGVGSVSRSGTHYRMASAILAEISARKTWNMSTRSDQCGCYRNDFRDRLHAVYRIVLGTIRAARPAAQ